jgi:broad specificity phosphatase PhoE
MKILMIRHPISEGNVNQIAQDNKEGKVHKRGYLQIDELSLRLKGEKFDHLYSSDSERCKELSTRLGELFDLNPEYNSLFREVGNGKWYNLQKSEMSLYRFEENSDFAPPGGESLNQLYDRARIANEHILNSGKERVVLVSHAWFLKAFIGRYMGLSPKKSMQKLKFSNCSLSEIHIEGEKFMVEYLNDRSFLKTR